MADPTADEMAAARRITDTLDPALSAWEELIRADERAKVRAKLLAIADEDGGPNCRGQAGRLVAAIADRIAPEPPKEVDPTLTCPRCGSDRWVSVSLDEGWTRRAQCGPCGQVHAPLGPGWRAGG
jgi:Uncharacterized Zn ribbon-containing protein